MRGGRLSRIITAGAVSAMVRLLMAEAITHVEATPAEVIPVAATLVADTAAEEVDTETLSSKGNPAPRDLTVYRGRLYLLSTCSAFLTLLGRTMANPRLEPGLVAR